MPPGRPAALRRAAALALAAAALFAAVASPPPAVAAARLPGGLVLRSEGRAPLNGGRADAAYQQALDEAFRRALLEALRTLVPERQSAADLESWQLTILVRASDFVAAWRVLAHEEDGGFLRLEVEVGIWQERLAEAARASGRGGPGLRAGPAARVLVLADIFAVPGRGAAEELDAGRAAAAALEAELARRGAVIVGGAGGTPWQGAPGAGPEEGRAALAAAEARRLGADAAALVELTALEGERLLLSAQLVAARTGATLVAARAEAHLPPDADPVAALAPAARALAASLAARLAAARAIEARPTPP